MHFLLANEPIAKLVEASTELATSASIGPDTAMLLLTVFVLAVLGSDGEFRNQFS